MSLQLPLFPNDQVKAEIKQKKQRAGTLIDNMKLPVHRWFRYSAGFSAEWVQDVIKGYKKPLHILDPFAGSGTALIAADSKGQTCLGFETHPFMYRIARSKLLWPLDAQAFFDQADMVVQKARTKVRASVSRQSVPLLQECYTKENLAKLEALAEQYMEMKTIMSSWPRVALNREFSTKDQIIRFLKYLQE